MWTVAAGYAFFAWLVTPWMTEQSKTVVAAFFASRPQMLNLSVCVTLEAAVMITFCFDCFAEMRTRNTAFKQAVTLFLKLYPGILIGGVICYVLALDGSATAITKGLSGGTHPRTLPIKPLHTQGLPLL